MRCARTRKCSAPSFAYIKLINDFLVFEKKYCFEFVQEYGRANVFFPVWPSCFSYLLQLYKTRSICDYMYAIGVRKYIVKSHSTLCHCVVILVYSKLVNHFNQKYPLRLQLVIRKMHTYPVLERSIIIMYPPSHIIIMVYRLSSHLSFLFLSNMLLPFVCP